MQIHDYSESNERSYENHLDSILSKANINILETFDNYETNQAHKKYQDGGVDRKVEWGGSTMLAEYKADSQAAKWNNAFIEVISNDVRGTPGCIVKSLAGLLVYYVPPWERVYFASMVKVKWHIPEWDEKYKRGSARNKRGYTTWGIKVPFREFKQLCCFAEWDETQSQWVEYAEGEILEQLNIENYELREQNQALEQRVKDLEHDLELASLVYRENEQLRKHVASLKPERKKTKKRDGVYQLKF